MVRAKGDRPDRFFCVGSGRAAPHAFALQPRSTQPVADHAVECPGSVLANLLFLGGSLDHAAHHWRTALSA